MKIRLANAPVSWGIMEVAGWSPPLPYTTFLDELKSAGYDGTELGPYGYLPTDPQTLSAELKRRSLTLTSAFVPLRLKQPGIDLEEVRKVGTVLQALGAPFLVLSDALWTEREAVAGRVAQSGVRLGDSDWKTVGANVRAVSGLASSLGLRCAFHHHAGTYIETPGEVARLLELTGVGLCLDTGHYAYAGGDPVEAVRGFGPRIEYLHCKDVDPVRLRAANLAGLSFLDGVRAGVFCELGTGCVRFRELLDGLERISYDGWAVVEQDIDAGKAATGAGLKSARASREYLRWLGL
ncbi:MAG TPA: TIM barrel protein [Bryobacterales bacterium]|nr:TIM barrel protein [Bryobacterales bacterium]